MGKMKKLMIAPSLMGMDVLEIKKQIAFLNQKAYMYHVDILDWHYAKNLCFSPDFISQIKTVAEIPIEAHLMVEGTDEGIINAVIEAGADYISLQADEVSKNIFRYIDMIKQKGRKLGIVLNPSVPLSYIESYLDQADLLTFMGVTPGFAGQKLSECVLDKIAGARELRDAKGYYYQIEIDGGCHMDSIERIGKSGIDVMIVGKTLLFGQDEDICRAWDKMERIFEDVGLALER